MPETQESNTEEQYQKLPFNEFLNVAKWSLKFIYSISPFYFVTNLVTSIFSGLTGIVNTYIMTRILNVIVELAQKDDAQVRTLYPYMAVLIGFNALSVTIRNIERYSFRALDIYGRPKIRRALYLKLNSLGIQTLEDPKINNKIQRAREAIHNIVRFFDDSVTLITRIVSLLATTILLINLVPIIIPIVIITSICSQSNTYF